MGWWNRRSQLKTVKVVRRIGEDEVLELLFNEESVDAMLTTVSRVLDFLWDRMTDRNKKILDAAEELSKVQAKSGKGSVERIR
jgi:hypothetical protein